MVSFEANPLSLAIMTTGAMLLAAATFFSPNNKADFNISDDYEMLRVHLQLLQSKQQDPHLIKGFQPLEYAWMGGTGCIRCHPNGF